MNKNVVAMSVVTLALCACAQLGPPYQQVAIARPPTQYVAVPVSDGDLITDPGVTHSKNGEVLIWRLISHKHHSFRGNQKQQGIEFEDKKLFSCDMITHPTNVEVIEFSCTNNAPMGTKEYKYRINVDKSDGEGLKTLDPHVVNN